MRRAFAATALAMTAAAGPALAQDSALEAKLAAASRIDCVFTTKVTGDWTDGAAQASNEEVSLEAAFYDVDVNGGTAEAEGMFGSTYIVVRHSYGYLHFLQMSNVGPLYVTTVLAQESVEGRFKAVHTRHEYSPTVLPGFTSRPEMYVGDCSVAG